MQLGICKIRDTKYKYNVSSNKSEKKTNNSNYNKENLSETKPLCRKLRRMLQKKKNEIKATNQKKKNRKFFMMWRLVQSYNIDFDVGSYG